jgi:hypothetical protein
MLCRMGLGICVRRLDIDAGKKRCNTLEEWSEVTTSDTLRVIVKGIQRLTVKYKA